MKKRKMKLYIATGVLMLTSVMSAQPILSARAETISQNVPQYVVKNSSASTMAKTTLSKDEFINQLIKEHNNNENEMVAVWKLGEGSFYKSRYQFKLSELRQEVPENVSFVTINGKNTTNKTVFIVDNDDLLVNTVDEYQKYYKEYGMVIGAFKKIHTGLDITTPKYLKELLGANGLFSSGIGRNKPAGVTVNTQAFGLSYDYARLRYGMTPQVNSSLEEYIQNDKNIIKLIHKSGAAKETTDENKIKKWLLYVFNYIEYDHNSDDTGSYAANSNILSLATRKLAMCVGFSLGSARALNLMGIPAYFVEGSSYNVGHATVRAYYNHEWHTLDVTSGAPYYYYDSNTYHTIIDKYKLYDKSPQGYSYNPNDAIGVMSINKDYEDWAEQQKTEDLVLFNKQAILNHKNPKLLSDESRQKLIQRYELLKSGFEKLSVSDANYKKEVDGSITTLTEHIEALKKMKRLYLDKYNDYKYSADFYTSFLKSLADKFHGDALESQLKTVNDDLNRLVEGGTNNTREQDDVKPKSTVKPAVVNKDEGQSQKPQANHDESAPSKEVVISTKQGTETKQVDKQENKSTTLNQPKETAKKDSKTRGEKEIAKKDSVQTNATQNRQKEVDNKQKAEQDNQLKQAQMKRQQAEKAKRQDKTITKAAQQQQEEKQRRQAEVQRNAEEQYKRAQQDETTPRVKSKRHVEQPQEEKKEQENTQSQYTGLVNKNGYWQFMRNGQFDGNYTGLVQHDNQWYYVQKGILYWGVNAVATKENDNKMYYVSNATLDMNYTGLAKHADDTWYYVKNGVVDKTYSGLVLYQGTWYNVNNGVLDWTYTNVVRYYDDWYYVQNGQLHWGVNGFVSPVKNGQVDKSTLYYVSNSTVTKYTGLMKYTDGTWLYFKNGQFDKTYSGLVLYQGTWFNVNDGILDWQYTSLVQHDGRWYYIQNGQLNWGQTALVRDVKAGFESPYYYVTNSTLDTSYTGLAQSQDRIWHYVKAGKEDNTYTGLVFYYGTWYYVANGILDWNYTGIVAYNGKQFYVQSGKIDWHFSGTVMFNGKNYTIQSAQVV